MREVQIYIEDKRIDLFKDETIEVTSSIQDARDISKVFTEYSQSFTVPASAANNGIFKHFYNVHITTGNFDARKYHKCEVYLNHLLYKRGRMVLNSVSMKNQKVSSYNITFYGNTVSLKDILGEDKLQSLDFSAFDHSFSYTDIKSIFTSGYTVGSDSEALIYPLITSKKRLFYDSSLADDDNENFNGNLYHTSESSPSDPKRYSKRGVTPLDLKPAIKLQYIVDAIESKYSELQFTSDSFFSSSNDAISNLYMWMSNRSGNLFDDGIKFNTILDNYALNGSANLSEGIVSIDGDIINLGILEFFFTGLGNPIYELDVIVNDVANVGTPYTVNLISQSDGEQIALQGEGDATLTESLTAKTNFRSLKVELSALAATTYTVQIRVRYSWPTLPTPIAEQSNLYDANNGNSLSTVQNLRIKDHLPELKILDFLTGMFKMFNLTAYFIDDEYSADYGKLRVIPLNDYYNDAVNNQSKGLIDITKYVDVKEHLVSTSFPFSDIDFKFEEQDTLLIKQHNDAFAELFGNSHLPIGLYYPNLVTGKKYEIKVPFSHLKYERLLDGGNDNRTDIQWGYAAGGDFNPKDRSPFLNYDSEVAEHKPPEADYSTINLKPLLFYAIKRTSISTKINFANYDFSSSEAVDSYFMPSNNKEISTSSTPATFSINFDSEVDEYSQVDSGVFSNSLFNKFYRLYIESVFNQYKRIYKFTAYLPPNFLIHYRLNDQLKIQDMVYRINSITTNLNTGKATLELINLNSEEIVG